MPPNKKDEIPEYPFAAPFGGLQSEVPPSSIGNTGFAEIQNILFRNSAAQILPAFTPVPGGSPDNSPIMGMFDFFDLGGARRTGVFTQTKMFEYQGRALGSTSSVWNQISPGAALTVDPTIGSTLAAGVAFTGGPDQFFQTAVVQYKLYFSQGADPIQVWDGRSAGYNTADWWPIPTPTGFTPLHVLPVPAIYLMELGFHLLVGNTVELTGDPLYGITVAPQKVHWSATFNGAIWSDFSSGSTDLGNNLGPITGMARLFQSGYIWQYSGITIAVPTGNALQPFDFVSMGAYAKGNTFRYGLAAFGEMIASYVGRDDIYVFDGTSSTPIGQHPIDGNRRLGARTRIFNDLFKASQYYDQSTNFSKSRVWGVITTAANATTYESYWLFIPELNKAWVYNFDESNWAQMYFQPARLNGPAASTTWFPQPGQGPLGFTQIDSLIIADNQPSGGGGPTVSYLDFTRPASQPTVDSINPGDGWYVRSGTLDFDDNRHPHNVNKLRIVLTDVGVMQFYLRLSNEAGYVTPLQLFTIGEGKGGSLTTMIDLQNGITGKYIVWELSGPPGVPFQLVEITPYPVVGGEVMTRCEVVLNPPEVPSGPGGGVQISVLPGSASLAPNETLQFQITITGTTNTAFTASAVHGTITATGLYTAPNVTSAVTDTVTITSVADVTKSATVQVSVQPGAQPISVTVAPTGGTLTQGQTLQFSAVVNGSINQSVTWTASAGTITSPGGLYTAPATISSATSATITATAVADTTKHATATISLQPPTGTAQLDLLQWMTLSTRTTQHLAGDPSAPYEVQYLDTDSGYPANYPKGCLWFIKNKLGNPWDLVRYDANYALSHWITENGDSQYQAQCQSANGTSCWLYAKAYKRNTTTGGIHILPRHFTPGTTITIDNPAPNNVVRTADCESTSTTINLGPVRSITTGPHKISWGGSIDHGSGTLATAPNYDATHGVDTIKNQYMFSGSFASGFADVEETYYVLGFGRVAWYSYHNGAFVQKTVNTSLASGGHPAPNFPCGPGKSWFV